jgi:hypothetical protein
MAERKPKGDNPSGCPESVSGCSAGGNGNCRWCGRRVDGGARRPSRITEPTELGQEYRRHYDPDYGTGKDDT